MKKSLKIDLAKVATDKKSLVRSMTEELEGLATGKPSSKARWAARFAASGLKMAPKRD
jgi:hypothetical protein